MNKKKGIFKYDDSYISDALRKFSDEFDVPAPLGNAIRGALSIAYASDEPIVDKNYPISCFDELINHSSYSHYQMLCSASSSKPRNWEIVRFEQKRWFDDPAIGEADPIVVFGLKISLWKLHLHAPDGTLSKTCPVCGFEPDFFYLNSNGEFNLVCARCDYDWRYKRTSCPFCGSELPTDISYLVSTNDFARLRECHACGRKLSGVDARRSKRPFCYILEKFITGHVLGSLVPVAK